jgi:hypothetical protein
MKLTPEQYRDDLMLYLRAVCAANSADTQYQKGIRDMAEVVGFWLENDDNFNKKEMRFYEYADKRN